MKGNAKIALVTNVCLGVLLLAVCAVCFLPTGVFTAGKTDRVYYSGDPDSKYISLMFNVYWGNEYLGGILDTLDEYGVKATFFIGGCWVDDNAALVKEIDARGHELANHGYFHKDQDKLSYAQNEEEIRVCGELLKSYTGKAPDLFAPPSGAYSDVTVDAAEALGYKVILWSKDTIDWRDKDESLIYSRAVEGASGGDLVLMHPTAQTEKVLPAVLQAYREAGLLQVPVSVNIAGVEKV